MSFIDNIRNTTAKIGDIIKETYGPLAALDSSNYTQAIHRYPLDVGDSRRYPHTIEFQTWKPTQVSISDLGLAESGAKVGDVVNPLDLFNKLLGAAGNAARQVIPGQPQMRVNANQKWNDRMLDFTRRAEPSDLIAMYMPAGGWMDRISNQYNQASLTAAMGNTGLAVEAASSLLKEYKENGGNIPWGKAADMLNGELGMELLGQVAGAYGMDGGVITNAGLNALGYALNPQFEMLYSGTDLREFQFDFTMTPRSEKEAEAIRLLIKRLKFHASPAYISGQGRYIIPPSYFDITFKFNGAETKWLPKISTCVLKACDIDYTGGLEQWSTHADGSPIQIKMVLTFVELEMMHKFLRRKGY